MKKSHNKIIFGFILLIIIIFVSVKFANNTNATHETFELLIDDGGPTDPTAPTDPTTPTTPTTSILNLSYQLKDNKYSYYPGDPILVTVGTAYNTCNNVISNTKVSGFIDDEGPSSTKTIINNIIPGGYSLEGTGSYTAPSRVGLHNFYGRLNIYATNQPKIVVSATSTHTELETYYSNQKITIAGKEYLIVSIGYNDLELVGENGVHLPIQYVLNYTGIGRPSLNYNQAGQNLTATYFKRETTDILQKTQDFTIPFEVIARPTNPTGGKTISVEVYDITNPSSPVLLEQDPITRTTKRPILPGTSIRLKWVATGFNNSNIICTLPNGVSEIKGKSGGNYEYIQPPESKNTYPQITNYYKITCVD